MWQFFHPSAEDCIKKGWCVVFLLQLFFGDVAISGGHEKKIHHGKLTAGTPKVMEVDGSDDFRM